MSEDARRKFVMQPRPAPWHYQERSDAYTHIVRAADNQFVVQMPQDTSGIAEAEARLISAAPDLLAAVKAMASFWAYGLNKPKGAKPNPADLKEVERLATMAADAVAKAEGIKR